MKKRTVQRKHPIVGWVVVAISIIALAMTGCTVRRGMERAETKIPKNVITDVRVVDTDEAKKVVIEAESPLTYTFFRLIPEPLQLVVDIPQTELSKEMPASIPVADVTISEILATQKEGKTEIGIRLNKLVKYDVQKEGTVLSIAFERKPGVLATEEVKEAAPAVIEEGPPVAVEIAPKKVEAMVPATNVVDVSVDTSEKETVVVSIKGDGKIGEYNAFGLEEPTRLVVDLKDLKREFPRKSVVVDSLYLSQVRLGDHPAMVRAVFDVPTETLPGYSIDRQDDVLKVMLGETVAVTEPIAPVTPAADKEEAMVQEAPTPPSAPVTGQVTGVDFKQLKEKSRLVLSTSTKAPYEVVKSDENTVLVELRGMVIPTKWIRHLDTQEFASPIDIITPTNTMVEDQQIARFRIELREMVAFDVKQEGTKLYLDFERPEELQVEKPKPIEVVEVERPAKKEEKPAVMEGVEVAKPAEVAPTARAEGAPSVVPAAEEQAELKVYTGKKITLDFKDADIGNILRLFAEVSDLNIIATEDVKGTVTVRLVDVPWDQALDIVLQAKSLGMERIGNVIRIAPIDRLRREREAQAKAIKATEELEPLVTELIPVNYSKGAELAPKVKDVLSDRGTVTVDERTNTLIVKDIRSGLEGAKDLVKRLDAQTPQVLIQAKIVEANTNFARELGISWGGSWTDTVDKTTGTVEGASSGTFAVDLPATVGQGSGGALDFLISNLAGTKFLEVKLSALEESGEGRILSSPRVTMLDHTEAYIEQGVRIPYPKLTEEGTVTTEFIEANLKLTVTPHVTSDGHIKMEIIASKDSPDFTQAVLGVPAIDKKEAKTEVLVKDGEVIVIGGVYSFEKTDTTDGVPFFHEIPVLGWAFKKKKKENEKKELLIFIAPRIIQPRRTTVS